MRFFLVFIFFIASLSANAIDIKESLFIDDSNSLTLEQIKNKHDEFKLMQKYNFGVREETFWIKLKFKNNSTSTVTQRVYNKRAGLDFVDVFVLSENNLTQTYTLGDMRDQSIRDNLFRISYFDLELQPFERVEIFIKQKAYGTMETKWQLANIDYFNKYVKYQSMTYFLIIGILIVATIASFMFFFFLKKDTILSIHSLLFVVSFTN